VFADNYQLLAFAPVSNGVIEWFRRPRNVGRVLVVSAVVIDCSGVMWCGSYDCSGWVDGRPGDVIGLKLYADVGNMA